MSRNVIEQVFHPLVKTISKSLEGFTLAELLIALFILGVISTFTIPKVLTAQNSQKYNAITKETAGMLSGAIIAYNLEGNVLQSSTTMGALTPYMNYVKVDTATTVDDITSSSAVACSDVNAGCLKLHNGAIAWYWKYVSFAGITNTNAIFVHLDPDGAQSSAKAINLWIYTDGKVATEGQLPVAATSSLGVRPTSSANDPTWWNGW
jgi:prepilin-type N-terminal cleavage/methylation domain-containing protein